MNCSFERQTCYIIKQKGYKIKNGDRLASLRYAKRMKAVATWSVLEPETLPPREHAMHFHSFRVHLQVCQWKYLNLHCLGVDVCG